MKKVLLGVVLAMLLAAAQAETFVTQVGDQEMGGYALLVGEDGEILTQRNTYRGMYVLVEEKGLYAASPWDLTRVLPAESIRYEEYDGVLYPEMEYYEYQRECLLGADGRQLTGFDYVELSYDEMGQVVIGYRPDARCDVLDLEGNVLLETDYGWMGSNGRGCFLALKVGESFDYYNDEAWPLVILDAEGREKETGVYAQRWGCQMFSGGFYLIYDADGVHRYLNLYGEEVFETNYILASDFEMGTAIIGNEDYLYGVIDTEGNYVLPMAYESITRATYYKDTALLAITLDGALEIYDPSGRTLLNVYRPESRVTYAMQVNDGMLSVSDGTGETWMNLQGEPVYRHEYTDDIWISAWYEIEDGSIPGRIVVSGGEWPQQASWLIDLDGNPASGDYMELQAKIWSDGQGRYLFSEYELVPYEYDGYVDWSVNWSSYRCGVCDENGNTILEPVYDSIQCLSLDRYWVQQDDAIGLIDSEGSWLTVISAYDELLD